MKDICSYCQREYGILSINNLIIFKTLDHIKPLNISQNLKSRSKKQSGMASLKHCWLTEKELDNLVECCNECNELKNNYYLKVFNYKLNQKSFLLSNRAKYLNLQLINNIKNSIKILLTNKSEEIKLNY